MHINAPPLAEQVAHQGQALVHHVQVGISALAPGIAVGHRFQDGLLLLHRVALFADLHLHGKVGAHVKGRVNVDQVNLAAELLQQGGHHQLVVAPDKHIAPVVAVRLLVEFLLGKGQAQLPRLRLARVARLVNRLDPLQRQRRGRQLDRAAVAILVVLALPDQFDLHAGKRVWIVGSPVGHDAYSLKS